MASNKRRDILLTQKSTNSRSLSHDQKRKLNSIPQMSPEARRAMGLIEEDTKENRTSSSFISRRSYIDNSESNSTSYRNNAIDNNNNNSSNINNNDNDDDVSLKTALSRSSGTGRQCTSSSGKRINRLPPRHSKTSSSSKHNSLTPGRSKYSDAPFSASDNTESCNQTTTASSASVYTTTNNSTSVSGHMNSDSNNHNTSSGKAAANPVEEDDDYDDDDDDENEDDVGNLPFEQDQDVSNGNMLHTKEKSFVLALDRALERNSISRLKGDITDTARIHEPGTVRALDGGRLSNAQEVVVNVCHNDDKQLVFHDDDEESLDTAKEISHIRVNIWMEYNSAFPPDNDIHDFQIPDNNSTDESSSHKRPTSSSSGNQQRRQSDDKNQTTARKTNVALSNNSTTTAKSKSTATDRLQANRNNNNNVTISEKTNKNLLNVSSRPKMASPITTCPTSIKSGSSGSSRCPSQSRSSSKRRPVSSSDSRARR